MDSGESRVQFSVPDAGAETAMVLGELYLRGDEWKFRAVGQGWDSGLAGLATDYGIAVEDSSVDPVLVVGKAEAPPTAESSESNGAELGRSPAEEDAPDPDDDAGNDMVSAVEARAELVESPPSVDVEEVCAATTSVEAVSTSRAPRPRSGVRTAKKRTTAATMPPLTLAVDPSWQPARLFSVTGVGNAEEQARRATSTLLSTMMAVREFGRALVARFGGPAGSIETYLEVPFTLDERTSIPDGVIRVARAGRIWTALLEVKTGTSGRASNYSGVIGWRLGEGKRRASVICARCRRLAAMTRRSPYVIVLSAADCAVLQERARA